MTDKPLTLVHLAYDWRDNYRTDPKSVTEKLARDQLNDPHYHFFTVCWSTASYEKQLDERIFTVHKHARFRHLRPLYDLMLFWQLPAILKRHNIVPDYFVVYDLGLYLSALRARAIYKKPALLFLSNLPRSLNSTRRMSSIRLVYQYLLEKILIGKIDHVFAISNAVARYAKMLHVPDECVHFFAPQTIPWDLSEILERVQGGARVKHAIPKDKKIILSVGRLEPEKGMDRLFRVFATLNRHDAVLIIVGDGVLRSSLEKLAEDLGVTDKVIFAGHVAHDELWQYYVDASVFVLLSLSESLGLVVWEAFAAGVPVIVSRAEGLLESVGANNERGFVWDEEMGTGAFEKCFMQVCEGGGEIQNMRVRAKKYVADRYHNDPTLGILEGL